MNAILVMVRSQLVRLWRSRTPLIIAIVGPLLLMLLAGYVFSAGYGLRIGANVPLANGLTEEVLTSLEQNHVAVQRYAILEDCEAAVRAGDKNACLVFSTPFGISEANNTITIIIDGADMALAGVLSDGLYGSLEGKTTSLSNALTSQLVGAIDNVRKHAADAKTSLIQATTGTNNALTNIRNAQGSTQGFDVAFDISTLNVGGISAETAVLRNSSQASVNKAVESIIKTIADLNNASVMVSALNASNTTNISRRIDNVTSVLTSVKDGLVSLNGTVVSSTNAVNASLDVIVTQMVDAARKLTNAATAKTGVESQLSSADANLNQALVALTTLQQSLDAIQNDVNSVKLVDPQRITRPINTVVQPLTSVSRLAGIVPVLIVLVVAFGGLLLAPRLVGMEKTAKAGARLALIVPIEMQAIASVITGAIIVYGQALVLVIVSLFFGVTVAPVGSFFVLIMLGLLFVALGTALGYVFKSEESSTIASFSVGIAMFLLSGLLFPLTALPGWLEAINAFNPLLVGGNVLRQVALSGVGITQASGISVLLLVVLLSLLLVWLAVSRDKVVGLLRR